MQPSSPQQGITGLIATNALSSCSMTWNGESWLVVIGRGSGVVSERRKSLPGALQAALAALGAPASLSEAYEPPAAAPTRSQHAS